MADPQDLNPGINAKRRIDRSIDELLGICKGVIADGVVDQAEAEFLLKWMKANQDAANQWPANVLYERLSTHLIDDVLDADEAKDLLSVIRDIAGGVYMEANSPSTLPVNDEAEIIFSGNLYVFTGVFSLGRRADVQQMAIELGANIGNNVTKQTNYLVIGEVGSQDWRHTSYGRKIEKAIEFQAKHPKQKLAILSESLFEKALRLAQ